MRTIYASLLIFAFYAVACSDPGKKSVITKAPEVISKDSVPAEVSTTGDTAAKPKAVIDASLSGIAKIVAGVSDSSSPYQNIIKYGGFKKYSAGMNQAFRRYEDRLLNRFRNWSRTELPELEKGIRNVFYPFSGPDIGYAHSLCPGADNYFMFGLEPVGCVPIISKKTSNAQIDTILRSMGESVHDNMSYSFFITKNMVVDLRQSLVKGTIPVLMFYMANLGLEIVSLDFVEISKEGVITSSRSGGKDTGVRIGFVSPKTPEKLQHVFYFSENIANGNAGFLSRVDTLCSQLPGMVTFVKSSSYCMHSTKAFKKIRSIILKHSTMLIQDDTGIPYSFLNNGNWNNSFYGKYTKPINLFSSKFQADFKKAMNDARAIDFKFGYNTPSNILVSRKAEPAEER